MKWRPARQEATSKAPSAATALEPLVFLVSESGSNSNSYILIGIQFNIFLGYSKFHHRLFGSSKASPLGNTKIWI